MKTIAKKTVQKDIALSASMAQKAVAGSPVDVKIRVENQGKSDVQFLARMNYWEYELRLLDATGQPVPLTRFGKQAASVRKAGGSAAPMTLAAGKSIETTLNVGASST